MERIREQQNNNHPQYIHLCLWQYTYTKTLSVNVQENSEIRIHNWASLRRNVSDFIYANLFLLQEFNQ